MRVIEITPEVQQEIERVKSFAEANILTFQYQVKVSEGIAPPIGDNPDYVVHIPHGVRVVYTIDEGKSGDRYRHMSISVDAIDKMPSVAAVCFLMREFGFNCDISECDNIYFENEVGAVNLIKKVE